METPLTKSVKSKQGPSFYLESILIQSTPFRNKSNIFY